MNWLQYLLEANVYLAVFYLVYRLFLNRETYYLFNRVYLLFSCIAAFVLPLIQLGFLRSDAAEVPGTALVLPADTGHKVVNTPQIMPVHHYFTLSNVLIAIYLVGTFIFTILLIIKLNRLFNLTRSKSASTGDRYKLVHLEDSNSAFSFFNYLFIGTKAMDTEIIVQHELVHIRQKHSVDILLLELVRIINWFNPIVYLLQNSLKTLHEYIADEQTAACKSDPLSYSAFLVNNAYGIGGPSITHSFFNYNLLKKRIIMLNQKRSGSLARLKYLVTLPVCAGLLCVSTLGFSKTYGWVVLSPKNPLNTLTAPKVKTLKSTEGEIVGYSDQMTIHGKTYTVNNLSEADRAYLQKTYNIKLEVVEIAGKAGQATLFFPSTKAKDTNNNSASVTSTSYTSKGYKFKETGYLINGKSNFRVVITEKNGEEKVYFKNSATPAQIKLLKDKYGYMFPTMPIYPKLPPPPPVPPVPAKEKTMPPPPPPVRPAVKIKELVSPVPLKELPPPMEPHIPLSNAFASLDKYIAVHTRYPAVARDNKVMGSVVAQFELNADHKITNVTLIKGIGNRCDEEAIRVLNEFNDAVDAKPGTYKLGVTFIINSLAAPKPASETLSNDPLFIGEVIIETYL